MARTAQVESSRPAEYVAVDDTDRLAVFRSSDGSRVRYLTAQQPGGGVKHPVVRGDLVYFIRALGTCAASINIARLDGTGEEQQLIDFDGVHIPDDLTLSGNGVKMGYTKTRCSDGRQWIVTRLNDGNAKESSFLSLEPGTESGPAFSLALDGAGDTIYYLQFADNENGPSLQARALVGDPHAAEGGLSAQPGCMLHAATWSRVHGPVVACATSRGHQAKKVLPGGGTNPLFSMADGARAGIDRLSFDLSGKHLLFATVTGDTRGSTYRWSGDGNTPTQVARNQISPTW